MRERIESLKDIVLRVCAQINVIVGLIHFGIK